LIALDCTHLGARLECGELLMASAIKSNPSQSSAIKLLMASACV
jgi:hypothetical protein